MKRRDFVCLWLSLTLAGFNAHAARPKRNAGKVNSKSKRPSKTSSKAKNKGNIHHHVPQDEGNWEELWNGSDLAGWKSNVPPTTGSPEGGQPAEVFSVVEVSGDKLLRISGHRFGALVSEASYRNYQLRLEWRWGVEKWAPRAHLRRSSGLVVHSLAGGPRPFGAGKSWQSGLELELQEGSCGDLVVGDGMRVDVPARRERFMGQPLYVFAAGHAPETLPQADAEPRVVKSKDAERGYGEWNVTDAYLFEQDGAFVINGTMALRFQNIRQVEAEAETPVLEGPVQLTSEGAEVFVRRIALRPLEKMPDRFRSPKVRR